MSERREIIVTGIHGFVGEHLAIHLKDQGYSVHGIGREVQANDNVAEYLDTYSQGDLLDIESTKRIPFKAAFAIIHLAGLASVADSFKYPERYIRDNAVMTDNLLSTAAEQGFDGRSVVISTGALYDASQPMPLNESSRVIETSPYSVGKIAAEKIAVQHKNAGLDVVIARPFNHIGPGQGQGFLLPDLYQKILEATSNGQSTIATGTLDNRRDFTDVRDIVEAYILLATTDSLQHDIYNVSSGNSYSGQDILNELVKVMGVDIEAIVDHSKDRPTDAKEIIGDSRRIQDELGWKPSIPLSVTVADFVPLSVESDAA